METFKERINVMHNILNPGPTLSEILEEQAIQKRQKWINKKIVGVEDPEKPLKNSASGYRVVERAHSVD